MNFLNSHNFVTCAVLQLNCNSECFVVLAVFLLKQLLVIRVGYNKIREHAVVQLVEALRYKPEGRGFDSR
jgi:hypothetical protein